MNKLLLSSLCLSPLLVACGGSSSSSGETSELYQWQIVQLKSVVETDLSNSCVIYADSNLNDGEVITAYIAETDYNIIYHNEDGSIDTQISADEISNGLLTIDASDVPDNGYVTLEEVSEARGGDTGSYMFSVQKSLLSDLLLNIYQEQTGSCYKGDDFRESGEAFVNVQQPTTAPSYYQTSFDETSVSGQETATMIPVISPYPSDRNILVTAFDNYDDSVDQKTVLTHWAFVDSSYLYEDGDSSNLSASLTDEVSDLSWSSDSAVTLDELSGVIAVHEGNSYFWQPLYAIENDLSVAYTNDEISTWATYFSGSVDDSGWLFQQFYSLSEQPDSFTLSNLDITSSVETLDLLSSCTVSATFCLDTGASYSSDDFAYQRTHLRITEQSGDSSLISYQSIYSMVNEQPVVLQSALFEFDEPTLDRAEFNLMSSDAEGKDAVQYLMSDNIDLVSVGEYSSNSADDDAETSLYNDINGFVSDEEKQDELYQLMLESHTRILSSSSQAE